MVSGVCSKQLTFTSTSALGCFPGPWSLVAVNFPALYVLTQRTLMCAVHAYLTFVCTPYTHLYPYKVASLFILRTAIPYLQRSPGLLATSSVVVY